jgi:hypothetical protein
VNRACPPRLLMINRRSIYPSRLNSWYVGKSEPGNSKDTFRESLSLTGLNVTIVDDDVESDRFPIFRKESDSMFNQLFSRSDALTRQLSTPLVEERRQYLVECASQGMSRTTLRAKSLLLLLSIVEHLRLGHRPKDRISLVDIKDAARRWSRLKLPSAKSRYVKDSRAYFITLAVRWLSFLNRFHSTSKPLTVCDRMLTEFTNFMSEDRGLSPKEVFPESV